MTSMLLHEITWGTIIWMDIWMMLSIAIQMMHCLCRTFIVQYNKARHFCVH